MISLQQVFMNASFPYREIWAHVRPLRQAKPDLQFAADKPSEHQRGGRIIHRHPETELIYQHTCTTRHDAELAIFGLIEVWCNPGTDHRRVRYVQLRRIRTAFDTDTTTLTPSSWKPRNESRHG